MNEYDATPFTVINKNALQVILWAGKNVPDSLIPLDGRIINGVMIPDHRRNFIHGHDPNTNEIVFSITECVLLKDVENIIKNGETKLPLKELEV